MIFNYASIALLLLTAASEVKGLKLGECSRKGDRAVCWAASQFGSNSPTVPAKFQPDRKTCADLGDFGRTRCCKADVLKGLTPDKDQIIQIPRAKLFHGTYIDHPTQGDDIDCV
ncbi:hypothetical protein PSHT_07793 [Puccinia striiformis]|uniref:Hydrophobin n=1 Tax=Puccinia striiformis TaxID=27350 RepID=A0A2S4VUR4_9BASI|nr:hypothetical protein PSHT_07793 [Puccinia striiformis]